MDFSFISDPHLRGFTERLSASYFNKAQLDLRRLMQLGDEHFEGRFSEGGLTRTHLYDVLQAAYNAYLLQRFDSAQILDTFPRGNVRGILTSWVVVLARELDLLPAHNIRDDKKLELQQFSTPPDLTLLLAWVAGLRPTDYVWEPSAGLGALATAATLWGVRRFFLNEIDPARRKLLDNVVFDFFRENPNAEVGLGGVDGAFVHTVVGERPDVVLMNPPFSFDKGHHDPMTAARHVSAALQKLAIGGRLVALLPGGTDGRYGDNGEDASRGMVLRSSGRYGAWWDEIQSLYTVRCDVGIAGSVFKRFGTTTRTRLVVIDKVGPAPAGYSPIRTSEFYTPAGLFADALKPLTRIADNRPEKPTAAQAKAIQQAMDAVLFGGGSAGRMEKFMESATAPVVDAGSSVEEVVEAVEPSESVFELTPEDHAVQAQEPTTFADFLEQTHEPEVDINFDPLGRSVSRGQIDLQYKGKLSGVYDAVAKLLSQLRISRRLFNQEHTSVTLTHKALKEELIVDIEYTDGPESGQNVYWFLSLHHYSYAKKEIPQQILTFNINAAGQLQFESTEFLRDDAAPVVGVDIEMARGLMAYLVQNEFHEAEITAQENEAMPDALLTPHSLAIATPTPTQKPQDNTPEAVKVLGAVDQFLARGSKEASQDSSWAFVQDGDEDEEPEIEVTAPINIVPDRDLLATDEEGDPDNVFRLYKPFATVAGTQPHNVPLVESLTMGMVNMPVPKARASLPRQVIESGALSSMQVEKVLYAANAHAQMLPDTDTPCGFFVGDGTGAGKGRTLAAIVMDNDYKLQASENRRVKALWVTKEFSLLTAARKDWHDLGGDKEFLQSHAPMRDQQLDLPAGIIVSTYTTMSMVGNEQRNVEKSPLEVQAAWDAYELRAAAVEDARKVRKEWVAWVKKFGYRDMYPGELTIIEQAGGVGPQQGETTIPLIKAAVKSKEDKPSINRLQQIIDWQPDVIGFDESHLGGNAIGKSKERGGTTTSQRGEMMLALLEACPNAKVVFLSATGATEVHNLGYSARRIGLCGPEVAAFPDERAFIGKITKGGMLAMELVAKDMKALGYYHATNLSYAGTTFELIEHKLARHQRRLYDESCFYWRTALDMIEKAFQINDTSGKGIAATMSAFWGAAQRFYNQILISMQAPTAIAYALAQMKAGHAVVVQLVNTNEAATERAVGDALAHEANLDDLDITPKDTLAQFVRQSFPTIQYWFDKDDGDNGKWKVLVDENGDPVQNPDAIRLRDMLLEKILAMRAPQGALDMFLERCAAEGFPMAEVTGRSRRYLMKPVVVDGAGPDDEPIFTRQMEARSKAICDAEAAMFMDDKLQALVFSDAGNTGRSFQSDLRKKNQRRRIHIVLQPGWRADNAIQGMGRTHRTNQRVPPHYALVTTDMPGQRRFVSSIARRIEQLGSLTKGSRKAANSGLFSDADNIETKYALSAIHQIFYTLWYDTNANFREAVGCSFYDLQRLMGLKLVDETVDPPCLSAKQMAMLTVTKFLNRLLFLPTKLQESVFAVFESLHESIIENAKQLGTFDRGVEQIKAEKVEKVSDKLVYTDPGSGAATRIVRLKLTKHRNIITFDEMLGGKYITSNERGYNLQEGKPRQYVYNDRTQRISTIWEAGMGTTKDGQVLEMVRMVSPEGTDRLSIEDFAKRLETQISEKDARAQWDQHVKRAAAFSVSEIYLVTGAVLPVWDKLGDDSTREGARIYVAETAPVGDNDGERLIGREILHKNLDAVMKAMGVVSKDAIRLRYAEVVTNVMQGGHMIYLSNKWRLERRRMVNNAYRMVLTGVGNKSELVGLPGISTELDGREHVHIVDLPTSQAERTVNVAAILRRHNMTVMRTKGTNSFLDVVSADLEELKPVASEVVLESYDATHLVDWQETILPWPPAPFDLQQEEESADVATGVPVPEADLFTPAADFIDLDVAATPVLDEAALALTKVETLVVGVEPEPEPEPEPELSPEELRRQTELRIAQIMQKYPKGSLRNRLLMEVYGQTALF